MTDAVLLAHLRNIAASIGMKNVHDTCKVFLLEKTYDREGYEIVRKKKVPRPWVLEAMDRQKGRCPRCGEQIPLNNLAGDHRVPLASGGKHHRNNIDALHQVPCNAAKGSRSLAEDAKYSGVTATDYLSRTGMK